MGDRTHTTVTFRKEYIPIIANVAKSLDDQPIGHTLTEDEALDAAVSGDQAQFEEFEANYGEMRHITNILDSLHIPYDSHWEAGSNYDAGTYYARFDVEGNLHGTENYESTEGLTSIQELLKGVRDEQLTTLDEMVDYLEEENKKFAIFEDQNDVTQIPIRELSEDEKVMVMKYKMEESNEDH